MLIALMADIHSNRQALSACLSHAQSRGAARHVFLGDSVGYGGDPAWVVDTLREMTAAGALAVLGNHDHAILDLRENLSPDAEIAIQWTRRQLGPEAREFLATLPRRCEDETRLYVHASPQAYPDWPYMDDSHAAGGALRASQAQVVFCGHVHVPALHGITATGQLVSFRPVTGAAVPLPRHRRWLAVVGSVGQPRDGDPAAAYALLDTTEEKITFLRVPYDVEGAAASIRAAGLPEHLAARLAQGR